ncbi:MAG: ATP-binding cassette domain-containing protein [Anaerolineae bacterium]|nr:ATP-binding cassette domain-containing protein [Anaerolineae bacterium]
MSNFAIKVEGLSKQYHIGGPQKSFDRITDQVSDALLTPIRRAGKLLKGHASGASELDESFWALQDVSFEIKHGEVVGIVGHNGAGKSTLLKILSDITEPTKGYADIYGRVGSLLEVGTGFHPELTGRENIFLNGAILGMKKAEIARKFDAIVDFAETEKFLDTPVKHYSSGMYVRLAFAVAAHLEPEVLLVDEVLAVGDVAFQKKCLGKMDDVSRQGRTIIFVSHNMNALQRLCPKSIWLKNGKLIEQGDTANIIERYLSANLSSQTAPEKWIELSGTSRQGSGKVQFAAISYSSRNTATGCLPFPSGPLEFSLDLVAESAQTIGSMAVTISDRYGTKLVNADTLTLGEPLSLQQGHNSINLKIEELYLNPGIYTVGLWAADPPSEVYDHITTAIRIEVVETEKQKLRVQQDGAVVCNFKLV